MKSDAQRKLDDLLKQVSEQATRTAGTMTLLQGLDEHLSPKTSIYEQLNGGLNEVIRRFIEGDDIPPLPDQETKDNLIEWSRGLKNSTSKSRASLTDILFGLDKLTKLIESMEIPPS